MRTKWAAINLALLMIISTTLTYMVDFEETNQIHEEDLEENSQVSSVDSRSQTHAEWKFDTTQFAMLEGDDGVLYPCKSSIGITLGGNLIDPGNPVDPHEPQGSGTAWEDNPVSSGLLTDNDGRRCFSWDNGLDKNGFFGFGVQTGDGTTSSVPETKPRQSDLEATLPIWNYNYQYSESTGGLYDFDNVVDMEIDDSGNTYVVGAWVGDTLVFPNVVGSHVYLNNSGMTSNEPSDHDIFIAKMNSDGEWIWATSILSENIETASSISVGESGEIIVGGTMKCSRTTSNFVFSNTPLSKDQSISQSFAIQCQTDLDPTGFVAYLDTNGGFLAAKEIENDNEFSSVHDVVYNEETESIHFLGKIGGSESGSTTRSADSYVLGKMQLDGGTSPSTLTPEWIEYMDENVILSEISNMGGKVIVVGFNRDTPATYDSNSYIAKNIFVSSVTTSLSNTAEFEWTSTCTQPQNIPMWDADEPENPVWALSTGENYISMIVSANTDCGTLDSNFRDFQIVTLDSSGNWVWSAGDSQSPITNQLDIAYRSIATDLSHSSNDDLIVSINLGRPARVGSSVFIPSNHNSVGTPDMLLLRLDDDTGMKIWHHQEINAVCSKPGFGYSVDDDRTNVCPDNKRGGADARRVIVKGLDEIYVSGMVYGKEIFLHDGLPEHCDYNYAQPIKQLDPSSTTSSPGFVTVNEDFSNFDGEYYYTACADGLDWSDNVNPAASEPTSFILPQHGTQSHGGDPFFAKFDACPHAPVGATGTDIDTKGRNDWHVSPVLLPQHPIDNTRYDCSEESDYSDPEPGPEAVYGCTDILATNYNPLATIDDGSCMYDITPSVPVDLCECNSNGSLVNMSDLDSINFVEITSEGNGGMTPAADTNYIHVNLDFATNNDGLGDIFNTVLSDTDMMMEVECDLHTGVGNECYDFYTSDDYGNYDPDGEFIAIRSFAPDLINYKKSGNFDAVWLEMDDGMRHYAAEIVYFNHGINPAGTSNEQEILGELDYTIGTTGLTVQDGFTTFGRGFTLIVLCFDILGDNHHHDLDPSDVDDLTEEEIMKFASKNLSDENKFALMQNYSSSLPCGFNPTLTSVNVSSNYPVYEYGDIVTITYDLECLIEPVHYILRGELTGSNGVQITAHHPVEYQFVAGAPSTPDFEVQHDGVSSNPDNSLVFEILDVDEYCVNAILDYDHGQLQYYDTHCFQVNPNRALLDDDGDGVSNDIDECEDTREGRDVDEVGCSTPGLSAFSVILVTIGAALVAVRHRTATEELEQMITDMDEKLP